MMAIIFEGHHNDNCGIEFLLGVTYGVFKDVICHFRCLCDELKIIFNLLCEALHLP